MYVCMYIYIYIGLVRPQASRRGFFFLKKQYSIFTKLYVHLRGVLECVFKCPGKKMSNMASPANLTMLSRTASKFCAHICAAPPEIFFLDLKSYENSGILGPWPECQLMPTALTPNSFQSSLGILKWIDLEIKISHSLLGRNLWICTLDGIHFNSPWEL